MEVHPPHSPIHGVKDFFLHLFTITVGLLIALGLEAAVEHLHHRHQLAEARESIHAELAEDRKQLEEFQPRLKQQEDVFEQMLTSIRDVREHQPMPAPPKMFLAGVTLSRASWDTAQNSGALSLMPYDEASKLAEAYQVQTIFNQIQLDTINAFAPLLGALPAGGTMAGIDAMTATELDALEDKVRAGRGHARILYGAVGELDKKYREFSETP